MKRCNVVLLLVLGLLLCTFLSAVPATAAPADTVVGDGTAASCDGNALEAAVTAGGLVTFDCGGAHTILANTMVLAAGTTTVVDGGGLITISGEDLRQIFIVNPGASLTLNHVTLTDGAWSGNGGAAVVYGALTLNNSTVRDSQATCGVCDGTDGIGGGIAVEGAGSLDPREQPDPRQPGRHGRRWRWSERRNRDRYRQYFRPQSDERQRRRAVDKGGDNAPTDWRSHYQQRGGLRKSGDWRRPLQRRRRYCGAHHLQRQPRQRRRRHLQRGERQPPHRAPIHLLRQPGICGRRRDAPAQRQRAGGELHLQRQHGARAWRRHSLCHDARHGEQPAGPCDVVWQHRRQLVANVPPTPTCMWTPSSQAPQLQNTIIQGTIGGANCFLGVAPISLGYNQANDASCGLTGVGDQQNANCNPCLPRRQRRRHADPSGARGQLDRGRYPGRQLSRRRRPAGTGPPPGAEL